MILRPTVWNTRAGGESVSDDRCVRQTGKGELLGGKNGTLGGEKSKKGVGKVAVPETATDTSKIRQKAGERVWVLTAMPSGKSSRAVHSIKSYLTQIVKIANRVSRCSPRQCRSKSPNTKRKKPFK